MFEVRYRGAENKRPTATAPQAARFLSVKTAAAAAAVNLRCR